MKGVRLTKAEASFLRHVLRAFVDPSGRIDWSCFGTKVAQHSGTILMKLEAAEAPVEPDHDGARALEDALIGSSRGKVVRLEGGWGMAGGMAKNLKATVTDAALIGGYLARSSFFTGPFTLLDALKKWHSWLPKARVTAPPPALQPGFNGEAQKDSAVPGGGGGDKRPAPGFGRGRKDPH